MLASHRASDADDPGPELVGLSQSREVPVGPQETLLRQVLDHCIVIANPVNHGPDKARVAVVKQAERLAVASQNSRHQTCIGRFIVPRHQKTSGRKRRTVQLFLAAAEVIENLVLQGHRVYGGLGDLLA